MLDLETDLNKPSVSTLISKNIKVFGKRTSVRLEPAMWSALHEIAERENSTIHQLCSAVHRTKPLETTLTAALRVFLMLYYRAAATEEGHRRAGHGDFHAMLERARLASDTFMRASTPRSHIADQPD
jgi:predicted DNA-binding ribbon-helix-helix protein